MKSLYLWLNIGSFFVPFIFSFHPKIKFYKKWHSLGAGLIVMMFIFIIWDVFFTKAGIWGFNDSYITGIKILELPIEEWLFFICIPYACIFTHYSLQLFFPKMVLPKKATQYIYILLAIILLVLGILFYSRWYTLVNFGYGLLLISIIYRFDRQLLSEFLPSFLVILIPFFIVNGILTGTGVEEPVVWYNDSENLSTRIVSIPVEDIIYALSMLLTVLFVMNLWEKRSLKNNN